MFSTGQTPEGAVNYTNTQATCGLSVNGDNPEIGSNQTNLTLPVVQACAAPIGPKWVASITNWLCYVIDAAGLTYVAGTICQNPLLLLNAIIALIQKYAGNIIAGQGLPNNSVGQNGMYYLDELTDNVYGPKASGSWPALPTYWGNNGVTLITSNTVIATYNQFLEMQGSSSCTATLLSPATTQGKNTEYVLYNGSGSANFLANIVDGVGDFVGTNISVALTTLTVVPGELMTLKSNGFSWVVVTDNATNTYTPSIATTTAYGIAREATLGECAARTTSGAAPAFVTPEGLPASGGNPFIGTGVGSCSVGNMSSVGGGADAENGYAAWFGAGSTFTFNAHDSESGYDGFYAQQGTASNTPAGGDGDTYSLTFHMVDYRWMSSSFPDGTWQMACGALVQSLTNTYSAVGTFIRIA